MRKMIFAFVLGIALLGASSAPASADTPFCDGWAAGYVAGYCYQQYSCLEPLVPLCPLPRLGEDGYKDGYNRGFLAGLNARQN